VYPLSVQELIDELGRLPGIGPKSAARIAFHLLKVDTQDALRLARAIRQVKEKVCFCPECFNIAEGPATPAGEAEAAEHRGTALPVPLCGICADPRRDKSQICVVEEPRDVVAIEKTREYRGLYHVLGGAISPMDGVGPDKLRIRELLARLERRQVGEVILCTNPNVEGDATALYLSGLLRGLAPRVTRIASGLPAGGDLEFADELTLGRALEGRREVVSGHEPGR